VHEAKSSITVLKMRALLSISPLYSINRNVYVKSDHVEDSRFLLDYMAIGNSLKSVAI
jgi:hypothetical protein